MAIDNKNPSAAVSSTLGKAKLHGLLIEKRQIENINRGGRAEQLSDDDLANVIAERARARREQDQPKDDAVTH